MAIIYSGREGTCNWTIDDQGHLYIGSGVISHSTTSYSDWSWYQYRDNIISVSSGQVTWTAGANALGMFYNCSSLTSLDLSNFNTSNVTNMRSMFYNCRALTSLDLSNFNTSNVVNMAYMFYECRALTSLDLSNFNTSNVVSMIDMFYGCRALTSLDLSNFNTSNVTNMHSMFYLCTSLITLNLSSFNTSKVTTMTQMFRECQALTSLNISNFDTSNVTEMPTMFNGCKALTSLDVSNFDTSKVTSIYGMFGGCKALTSLDVSNFDTSKVTDMSGMFSECWKLTSLDLLNFNTSKVINMSSMFYDCRALTSLNLSNFNTNSVTNMQSMFRDCLLLTLLDISNFDTSNVTNMYGMFFGCGATSLNLSSFDTSKVTNMVYMFRSCQSLVSALVSNLWNTNSVDSSAGMFDYCNVLQGEKGTIYNSEHVDAEYAHIDEGSSNPGYLTNINSVPCYASFDSSNGELKIFRDVAQKYTDGQVIGTKTYWTGIEDLMGAAAPKWANNSSNIRIVNIINKFKPSNTAYQLFKNCSLLTSLDLSNFDSSSVVTMKEMFAGCSALVSLDLSNFSTAQVTKMESMFNGCSSLISLDVSSFEVSNVERMEYMFKDCFSLTSLDLSIFDEIMAHVDYMFSNCQSLESLELPKLNKSSSLGVSLYNTFVNCSALEYLELHILDRCAGVDEPFTNVTCPIYIINEIEAGPTREGAATSWRRVADLYSNVHYEVDDFIVEFNQSQGYEPVITRYLHELTPAFITNKIDVSFYRYTNNLIPKGWSIDYDVFGYIRDDQFIDEEIPTFTNDNFSFEGNINCNALTVTLTMNATVRYKKLEPKKSISVSIEVPVINGDKPIFNYQEGIGCLTDGNFIYTIDVNVETEEIERVCVVAYNTNCDYTSVSMMPGITNLNVDVYYHRLDEPEPYGCFEYVKLENLGDKAITIPGSIKNLDRCFYGCTNLQGDIYFETLDSSSELLFDNAFTGVGGPVFLIDDYPEDSPVIKAIADASSSDNVHYKGYDNTPPKPFGYDIPTSRYTYDSSAEVGKKFSDNDDGEWVKIQNLQFNLYEDLYPQTWESNHFVDFDYDLDPASPLLPCIVLDESGKEVTAQDLLIGAPNTLYIRTGSQETTVTLIFTDNTSKSSLLSFKTNPIFAILDLMPGGKGMAIGKVANRNGLDIQFPTTIGEGLSPATKEVYKLTNDEEPIEGKEYYYLNEQGNYILITVEQGVNPSEQGYYEIVDAIDLNNYQLVVGKYNKENDDAVFIIGNGKLENGVITQSNLMEVGNQYIQIGQSDQSRLLLDYRSMQMKDKRSNVYFNIFDLRDETKDDGTTFCTVTEVFDFDDSLIPEKTSFDLQVIADEIKGVYVDDELQTENVDYEVDSTGGFGPRIDNTVIRFYNSIGFPSQVKIVYTSSSSALKAYTLGRRGTYNTQYEPIIGAYSLSEGYYTSAQGQASHSEGMNSHAIGAQAHAEGLNTAARGDYSHTEGANTIVLAECGHAEGTNTMAAGNYSHAGGENTIAQRRAQTVIGRFNLEDSEGESQSSYGRYAFIVGNGASTSTRSNAFTVDWNGNIQYANSASQMSDRRLKDHQSYLGIDANEFIRNLKPAHFIKDEQSHVGFYAQDVEEIDKWNCMTGEMNGFKTLNYIEIIAPLVAYCQNLEKNIVELKQQIKELEKR